MSREQRNLPLPPWERRTSSAAWGTREALSVTLVEAGVVVEVCGDTAVDTGRWRRPVRVLRARTGMSPQDVALFGPREELGAPDLVWCLCHDERQHFSAVTAGGTRHNSPTCRVTDGVAREPVF
ncbi:hypothetical protein [Streptomyces lydicus]|uniref:hypothetical protein n=1 Tax=Streptomyces lydicus TaxID=47763 RepID=UPI0037A3EDEE